MVDTSKGEAPLPSREELVALLSKPLDPKLDYYDATPAIEAIANHLRGLHKLINYLFHTAGLQGASVLQLREMQAAQAGAIEFLAGVVGAEPDEGPLAGIKPAALILPGKAN